MSAAQAGTGTVWGACGGRSAGGERTLVTATPGDSGGGARLRLVRVHSLHLYFSPSLLLARLENAAAGFTSLQVPHSCMPRGPHFT